ncbi:gliding motility protein GldB-related protein [Dyadobacter fermentans]|nr:DUF2268 domain-containing putative Zn-dependent protease [Dyadobacter fermentans]
MKSFQLLVTFLLPCILGHAQRIPVGMRYEKTADSLYECKNYSLAAYYYLQSVPLKDFDTKKRDMYYNAACCFALTAQADSAILMLEKAIELGYTNKNHLTTDPDLNSIHTHAKWKKLAGEVQEIRSLNSDPAQVRIVTDDIYRFWDAYDKANTDSGHVREVFQQFYFDMASPGMKDYMGAKVSSIDYFLKHIRSAPLFYQAIRKATLQIDDFRKDFQCSFVAFKEIYPAAKFPDIYFVMGAFTSGGTVSDAGLLIGLNQVCLSDDTPVAEFDSKKRNLLSESKFLPNLIAHELIHFQQQGMRRDTTTLSHSIKEGMADFLGELISGRTANHRLFEWAKGKEKNIWMRFKKDMYLNRSSDWIANSDRSNAGDLPDQGYWVGYQICKAYYDKAPDKKQAVVEMLNIRDYNLFLKLSGWEEKIEN